MVECLLLSSYFELCMQLRKEGRRNEYERHKLQALNQRQKMVRIIPMRIYGSKLLVSHF